MADTRDILVPDIGDFTDVPVIEVLVKPWDRVGADSPLVTLDGDGDAFAKVECDVSMPQELCASGEAS